MLGDPVLLTLFWPRDPGGGLWGGLCPRMRATMACYGLRYRVKWGSLGLPGASPRARCPGPWRPRPW
eukprot:10917751-Alexandrium_andersonii.AAC.1